MAIIWIGSCCLFAYTQTTKLYWIPQLLSVLVVLIIHDSRWLSADVDKKSQIGNTKYAFCDFGTFRNHPAINGRRHARFRSLARRKHEKAFYPWKAIKVDWWYNLYQIKIADGSFFNEIPQAFQTLIQPIIIYSFPCQEQLFSPPRLCPKS